MKRPPGVTHHYSNSFSRELRVTCIQHLLLLFLFYPSASNRGRLKVAAMPYHVMVKASPHHLKQFSESFASHAGLLLLSI